ncbi:LysR substrate-binding domain-containing protein [Massilia sp. MB5]|uniref:LysR substrate-binding domain-containing protein n=1 Tax=Massilia sp. MB5 TaxID=2919578 RepID=UPI001F0E7421|nr:LysR substrate-binding domain-containing protein [Massilia sp. MB5]UMR31795.1 LysR substrate-binding domain-containing protein [Massilia sp. MB5]
MRHPLIALPPLDALRGFVAAARRLSITQAADDLCLTQSAVSRQIQALEERLGTQLFTRSNRSITLTMAGEQLFRLCSPWMDKLAELSDSLREEIRPRTVTISASIGVASLWILPRLGAFQAAHPDIDVRLAANNRVEDLAQEDIDLAIRYSAAAQAGPNAQHLFDEQIVPVASPAVAQRVLAHPRGLLSEVLLDLERNSRPWLRWSYWLERKAPGLRAKGFLYFHQYDQIIQAALEGHGVALGRLPLIQNMLKDGRLQALASVPQGVPDYAYWLLQAVPEPREEVRHFRDWLLHSLR